MKGPFASAQRLILQRQQHTTRQDGTHAGMFVTVAVAVTVAVPGGQTMMTLCSTAFCSVSQGLEKAVAERKPRSYCGSWLVGSQSLQLLENAHATQT